MTTNYNKHDHTHCFNQKEPPCGLKGKHRCCLCNEPVPSNYNKVKNEGVEEFIETGADLEHERWSGWQKYLHSLCIKNTDGTLTIPKERVERWERQIATNYKELSEKEKEYDRIEVRKYTQLLSTYAEKVHKATLEDVLEFVGEDIDTRKMSGDEYLIETGASSERQRIRDYIKTLTK